MNDNIIYGSLSEQTLKLELHATQIVLCKRTAEEVSLKQLHPCRISSTDSKVRTTTVHTESITVL